MEVKKFLICDECLCPLDASDYSPVLSSCCCVTGAKLLSVVKYSESPLLGNLKSYYIDYCDYCDYCALCNYLHYCCYCAYWSCVRRYMLSSVLFGWTNVL